MTAAMLGDARALGGAIVLGVLALGEMNLVIVMRNHYSPRALRHLRKLQRDIQRAHPEARVSVAGCLLYTSPSPRD